MAQYRHVKVTVKFTSEEMAIYGRMLTAYETRNWSRLIRKALKEYNNALLGQPIKVALTTRMQADVDFEKQLTESKLEAAPAKRGRPITPASSPTVSTRPGGKSDSARRSCK